MNKLYFGYFLIYSSLLFFIGFLRVEFYFPYHPIFLIIGVISGGILFFWMTYNLFNNDKVKFKLLWFLSFLTMFIGCIFYFWFIYRKQYINDHK
jgi:hypothetical protein